MKPQGIFFSIALFFSHLKSRLFASRKTSLLAIYSPSDLKLVDKGRIPEHVAIIPDGNRRWARKQTLSILKGHREGADVLMDTLRAAKELGIKAVTFFTFSTENWSRPESEVKGLLSLIESYLEKEMLTLLEEGVRFHTIGQISHLPQSLQTTVRRAKAKTEACKKIDLILALNYGARDEMVRACRKIARAVASGHVAEEDITEALFASMLDTNTWKDPDLLIRTSGECRLSNFMLWQVSYGEIFITPVLWPEFTPHHLLEAVLDFQRRDRRLGGDG